MREPDASLEKLKIGQAALHNAAWVDARNAFDAALEAADTPEAHDGVAIALWWLNEIDVAHQHRTLAYKGFMAQGANGRAATIACWLGREQVFLHGNSLAMQGWFGRADRLLQALDSPVETAWCQMLRASVIASPQEMVNLAPHVIATARAHGAAGLEAFALAFYGQALVGIGQVGAGMAQLDEAMTMTTSGEVGDYTVISEVFCVMLSACELAGDLVRSDLWCRTARDFAEKHRCPFLSAYCRTSYGGLMTALGRWEDAEASLNEAIEAFEQGHRGLRIHALIKLADLRVCQGRIEEAKVMLDGLEDQSAAIIPLARLYLGRGDPALARAILEGSLPSSPAAYTLYHFPTLLVLTEVALVMHDILAAGSVVQDMERLVAQSGSSLMVAQIAFVRGNIDFQQGDGVAARAHFGMALEHLHANEQSWLAAQIRLRMAQLVRQHDPIGAVAWAKGALATFARIGAVQTAEAAKLLRELGAHPGAAGQAQTPLTRREVEIAELIAAGLTNREIADRLVISTKTVEHHVSHILDKLDLKGRAEIAAYAVRGSLGTRLE